MSSIIIWTIAVVTVLGLVLALVLYLVAQKFKVEEDPRIDEVEKVMPGANCGGCGFAGCRAFAEAAVKAPNLDNNYCTNNSKLYIRYNKACRTYWIFSKGRRYNCLQLLQISDNINLRNFSSINIKSFNQRSSRCYWCYWCNRSYGSNWPC